MARFPALRFSYIFCLVLAVQAAEKDETLTRYSRDSSLNDTALRDKLDSIISMLGKLNSKIDEQEQRIAVLSSKVSNIDCKKEPKKGTYNCKE